MPTHKLGVDAVVGAIDPEELRRGKAPVPAQPSLFADLSRPPPMTEADREARDEERELAAAEDVWPHRAAGRSVGRPKGALNRSTLEFQAFLNRRFSNPVVGIGRISEMSPETLAVELRCSLLDAFDRIVACKKLFAEYTNRKLAPEPPPERVGDDPDYAIVYENAPQRQLVGPGDDAKAVDAEIVEEDFNKAPDGAASAAPAPTAAALDAALAEVQARLAAGGPVAEVMADVEKIRARVRGISSEAADGAQDRAPALGGA